MLFLSAEEKKQWKSFGDDIMTRTCGPDEFTGTVRDNLKPAFKFFIGALLASGGAELLGKQWFQSGAMQEDCGLFSNAFAASFLERQQGRFSMPELVFKDPRPFVHFAGVPAMRNSRDEFVRQCGHTLPRFDNPVRVMDIGCGNGVLVARMLQELRAVAKIADIEEILLVDPSEAMLALARETVAGFFSAEIIKTAHSKIEDLAAAIEGRYDLALSSLAYHHMPYETKIDNLRALRDRIDHFVIFELDANNDTPELNSPELALSVYQSYGRIIDFVFAHDAPVDVAQRCVDSFLMGEAVSLLTQPRGARNDYHMLRRQWHEVFRDGLGEGFNCWSDSTCYADEYLDLFSMHYGRS